MEALIEQNLGNPLILAALLFLATFVMEEVAIFVGAGLAASGEMTSGLALASLIGGMIVSDWCLYGMGALAGRSRLVAGWVPQDKLDQGRLLLGRSTFMAGLLARIVPWLLFPVFVASGFLGVGFRRFALVNTAIAVVYIPAIFYGAFGIYAALISWLGNWAWLAGAMVLILLLWAVRVAARRYLPETDASDR
ncbi:DedA family protein [Paracoccus sp. SY]|uniref:DedA family protein n=1 Tax=Paracoccus sp. SY TaxID=1330255 RepID=UPI000CD103B4|nr:hypothetical protein [Paracoccus sp. SY]